MKMKIWICNPFDRLPGEAGSGGRYQRLAKALIRSGHTVKWWSSSFSHSSKTDRAKFDFSSESLKITLVPVRPYSKNVSLARIVNHRQFSRRIDSAMRSELESGTRPDLILVSMPLIGAASRVVRLAREFSIPVVVDVQDVWPDTFRLLLPKGTFFDVFARCLFWPFHRQVRRALEDCNRATATCGTFLQWADVLGGNTERHFYLGVDCRFATSPEHQPGRASNSSARGRLRIIYAGSMGAVYDLQTIILAAEKLKKRDFTFRIDFAGSGEQEDHLRLMAEEQELDDVIHFHGFLDDENFDDLLKQADVGLIAMHPSSQVAMPNKAADYLSAGLAIANTLPGELETKLSEYGCGRSYQADDPASLVEALKPWLEDSSKLDSAKAGARRLFEAEFDAAKIYAAYAEWLTDL